MAGARDEGNVLPSTKEELEGPAGQEADAKEGGFHTQLCYPTPGLSLAKSLHISPRICVLISIWKKDIDLKCFETYSDKIISKTMVGLTW